MQVMLIAESINKKIEKDGKKTTKIEGAALDFYIMGKKRAGGYVCSPGSFFDAQKIIFLLCGRRVLSGRCRAGKPRLRG